MAFSKSAQSFCYASKMLLLTVTHSVGRGCPLLLFPPAAVCCCTHSNGANKKLMLLEKNKDVAVVRLSLKICSFNLPGMQEADPEDHVYFMLM